MSFPELMRASMTALKFLILGKRAVDLVGGFRREAALAEGVLDFLLVGVLLDLEVIEGDAVIDILEHLALTSESVERSTMDISSYLMSLLRNSSFFHALAQRVFLVVGGQQLDGAVLELIEVVAWMTTLSLTLKAALSLTSFCTCWSNCSFGMPVWICKKSSVSSGRVVAQGGADLVAVAAVLLNIQRLPHRRVVRLCLKGWSRESRRRRWSPAGSKSAEQSGRRS